MHFLGLAGMPRRIPDYPDVYYLWNSVATFGSYVTTFSMVVFFLILYRAFIGFSWSVTFVELFALKRQLGLVTDYKVLVGNTTTGDMNSTRVNSRLLVSRPLNMRSSSEHEVGPLLARFVRRDLAFDRRVYGPIRHRWFRWRF